MTAYLDTSALVPLLVAEPPSERCRQIWDASAAVLTVEIAYVETAAALARAQRTGWLSPAQHREIRRRWEEVWDQVVVLPVDTALWRRLGVTRHPVSGLLDRVWRLREDVTAHDATYVALAEALGCAVVTADGRLARAPGIHCPVTVVPR